MVLSDQEIWAEIMKGSLIIDPGLEPAQVGPSSIDLRLGSQFTVFKAPEKGFETIIDLATIGDTERVAAQLGETENLKEGETFVLEPGKFVLAYTLESIELPAYLAARIEGRSSYARLGLSVHQTAPTVHATFKGQLRLEISHNGPYPCRLHPGLSICQLIVERLGSSAVSELRSEFQGQSQREEGQNEI